MAPSLKVTYFNFAGRAEPIRLALTIGGIDFEDQRLSFPEFGAMKPSLPFGQLPVMEIDGEQIAQGPALLRYAGKLAGMEPQDPLAALRVDEMVLAMHDVVALFTPSILEPDMEKKLEMRIALVEETLPKWFGMIERRIAGGGKEYCAGDSLSVADLSLYNFVKWMRTGTLDGVPATIMDAYPATCAVADRVAEHPKVKEWNETH
ncbi:unnamed protein product [Ostreobium quekettii]|uniref:Glutathione S-transferase n=1 Tax=Ostreobium quekettii TaxID=121088 RepID=A0A8S1J3G6_9CHLO|nr:unnamed protein product [Ostreobium quekettii]|eukprot:evm.model.scf_18.9 EVM.evm.TU.scf_18.9   scf_18:46287-46901(+)